MTDLVVYNNGRLVTTQSIISKYSENSEESIQRLIRVHKEKLKKFGKLDFELVKTLGRPIKIYYLNEKQAYLFMTFLKNSQIVINFKMALVKEFFKMREKLYQKDINNGKNINHIISGYKSQIAQHNNKIRELEERLKVLPRKKSNEYKTKYENQRDMFVNMYEEYWQLKSFVNQLTTKINQLKN